MAIKELTISQLEETEKGSIWILNSAARSQFELEGEILINIPNAQGKPDMMKIPQSWLPYEATAKFPKKRILESVEFRSAVMNGLISLISEEDAMRMSREDGAVAERQRIKAVEAHIKAAGAPRKISDANVDIVNPNELQRGNGVPVKVHGDFEAQDAVHQIKAGVQANADGLKPNFVAFFDKIKTMDDVSALNALKNKGRFARRELRWMRDHLTHHPKTVKAIKSRLVELRKAAEAAAE
jgi:hypothetical protein